MGWGLQVDDDGHQRLDVWTVHQWRGNVQLHQTAASDAHEHARPALR